MKNPVLKLLGNHLIVEPVGAKSVMTSGIVIPESAQDTLREGVVLVVGLGLRYMEGHRVPIDIKIGDNILFPRYTGMEVTQNGRNVLILKASDVLAIVEEQIG